MFSRSLFSVVYLLVIGLSVSFSSYTTYKGSLALVGGWQLAAMFATIVALCLFTADWRIRDDLLERGRPRFVPMLLLFAAILFSSLSHFNYFFTTFQGSQIARDSYRSQAKVFAENMAVATRVYRGRGALKEHMDLLNFVNNEGAKLRRELDDVEEPGFGEDAQLVSKGIRERLGSAFPPLDDPAFNETNPGVLNPWYESFMAAAREAATRLKPPAAVDAEAKLADISSKQTEVGKFQLQISDPESEIDPQVVQTETQKLADFSVSVSSGLLAVGAIAEASEFGIIDTRRGTGEIVYTLASAMQAKNVPTSLLALAVSLFIDLIPLLFALAAFRRRLGADSGFGGESVPPGWGPRP